MRFVIQRVTHADVKVDGETIGEIGKGFMVLIGVADSDTKEIADKIKEAREQGDLSENAEYDAARDEQRDNEAKIEELENLIKNAVVISDDDIDHNVANLGSAVTLKDLESGEEMEFSIVGSAEVNSLEFKISNESPLGKAMIGKKRGDIIKVEFMGNEVKYQVLDVKRY